MTDEDKLQENINRATAQHALRQIRTIVDEENKNDADNARALNWFLRYGWIALLALGAVAAYWMGGRAWLGF